MKTAQIFLTDELHKELKTAALKEEITMKALIIKRLDINKIVK